MNQRQKTMIKDMLYNLDPQASFGSIKEKGLYAKGILVATVGIIQAFECNFNWEQAIKIASDFSPRIVVPDCCPETWCDGFGMTEPQNGLVIREIRKSYGENISRNC